MLVGIRRCYYRGSSQQQSGPHCGPETLLTLGAQQRWRGTGQTNPSTTQGILQSE